MKIELDEKTIDDIVEYVVNNPDKIRKALKVIGDEAISVLLEEKTVDKGAKLYKELTHAINYLYKE
jgi:tagatose-1,6-bisphosphate aldolase